MAVSAFRRYNLTNVPDALRTLAEQISEGYVDAARCVVVLQSEDGVTDYKAFGADPFSPTLAVGMLVVGQAMVLERSSE